METVGTALLILFGIAGVFLAWGILVTFVKAHGGLIFGSIGVLIGIGITTEAAAAENVFFALIGIVLALFGAIGVWGWWDDYFNDK